MYEQTIQNARNCHGGLYRFVGGAERETAAGGAERDELYCFRTSNPFKEFEVKSIRGHLRDGDFSMFGRVYLKYILGCVV